MTVGHMKKLLDPLHDELHIIMVAPTLDEDGDESDTWFGVRDVTRQMDADTAEFYARFACVPLEDTTPDDSEQH